MSARRAGSTNGRTYLNSALSSVKPAASASTAAGVPIFRRANIARYRSKRGREASRRVCFREAIASSEVSSGAALPDSNLDEGGAGSMEVYVLDVTIYMSLRRATRMRNTRVLLRCGRCTIPVLLSLIGVIPLNLRERNLARLPNAPVGVIRVLLQNRDTRWCRYGTHRLRSLLRNVSAMRKGGLTEQGEQPTSCRTMGSSVSSARTDSRVGRATEFLICPRQYASSCFNRALSSAKPRVHTGTPV